MLGSGDQSLRLAQPDYLGHTLLCLIKNSGWRDLLQSQIKLFNYCDKTQ